MIKILFQKITGIVSALILLLTFTHSQVQAKAPVRSQKSTVRNVKGGTVSPAKKRIAVKKVGSRKPTSVKQIVTAAPKQRRKAVASTQRRRAIPPARITSATKIAPTKAAAKKAILPKQTVSRATLTKTRPAPVKQARSAQPLRRTPAQAKRAIALTPQKVGSSGRPVMGKKISSILQPAANNSHTSQASPLFTHKIDQTFLQTNFIKNNHERYEKDFTTKTLYVACDLGYAVGEPARTEQYSNAFACKIPAATVLHPYHPLDIDKMDTTTAIFLLNVKLPGIKESLLPDSLKQTLAAVRAKQPIDSVEAYFEVQDIPWKEVKGAKGKSQVPLCYRPQYALDPKAPVKDNKAYIKGFNIQVGFFSSKTNHPLIKGQAKTRPLIQELVTVHNSFDRKSKKVTNSLLLSSGNSLHIDGIDKANSHAFYSLTISGKRAIITKLVVLTEADRVVIDEALQHSQNVNQFRPQLNQRKHRLSVPNLADEFRELWEQ